MPAEVAPLKQPPEEFQNAGPMSWQKRALLEMESATGMGQEAVGVQGRLLAPPHLLSPLRNLLPHCSGHSKHLFNKLRGTSLS